PLELTLALGSAGPSTPSLAAGEALLRREHGPLELVLPLARALRLRRELGRALALPSELDAPDTRLEAAELAPRAGGRAGGRRAPRWGPRRSRARARGARRRVELGRARAQSRHSCTNSARRRRAGARSAAARCGNGARSALGGARVGRARLRRARRGARSRRTR